MTRRQVVKIILALLVAIPAVGMCLFSVLLAAGVVWVGHFRNPVMQEYEVDLPNGYSLWRSGAEERSILDPSGRRGAIGPDVTALGVNGHLVFGVVNISSEGIDVISEPPGFKFVSPGDYFFLLDTSTGEARPRMTKREWLAALKEAGIEEEPSMQAPSRDFKYY